MRILITGDAGFVGSHVAEAYRQAGHQVGGLDNLSTGKRENLPPDVPLWETDLTEESQLERLFHEFRPEIISHHAAQVNVRVSWERPLEDARSNVLGSLALFRQAARWKVQRVIYSSSGGGHLRRTGATAGHRGSSGSTALQLWRQQIRGRTLPTSVLPAQQSSLPHFPLPERLWAAAGPGRRSRRGGYFR